MSDSIYCNECLAPDICCVSGCRKNNPVTKEKAQETTHRMVFLSVQTHVKGGDSIVLVPGGVYYFIEAPSGMPTVWTIEDEQGSVLGYLHEHS